MDPETKKRVLKMYDETIQDVEFKRATAGSPPRGNDYTANYSNSTGENASTSRSLTAKGKDFNGGATGGSGLPKGPRKPNLVTPISQAEIDSLTKNVIGSYSKYQIERIIQLQKYCDSFSYEPKVSDGGRIPDDGSDPLYQIQSNLTTIAHVLSTQLEDDEYWQEVHKETKEEEEREKQTRDEKRAASASSNGRFSRADNDDDEADEFIDDDELFSEGAAGGARLRARVAKLRDQLYNSSILTGERDIMFNIFRFARVFADTPNLLKTPLKSFLSVLEPHAKVYEKEDPNPYIEAYGRPAQQIRLLTALLRFRRDETNALKRVVKNLMEKLTSTEAELQTIAEAAAKEGANEIQKMKTQLELMERERRFLYYRVYGGDSIEYFTQQLADGSFSQTASATAAAIMAQARENLRKSGLIADDSLAPIEQSAAPSADGVAAGNAPSSPVNGLLATLASATASLTANTPAEDGGAALLTQEIKIPATGLTGAMLKTGGLKALAAETETTKAMTKEQAAIHRQNRYRKEVDEAYATMRDVEVAKAVARVKGAKGQTEFYIKKLEAHLDQQREMTTEATMFALKAADSRARAVDKLRLMEQRMMEMHDTMPLGRIAPIKQSLRKAERDAQKLFVEIAPGKFEVHNTIRELPGFMTGTFAGTAATQVALSPKVSRYAGKRNSITALVAPALTEIPTIPILNHIGRSSVRVVDVAEGIVKEAVPYLENQVKSIVKKIEQHSRGEYPTAAASPSSPTASNGRRKSNGALTTSTVDTAATEYTPNAAFKHDKSPALLRHVTAAAEMVRQSLCTLTTMVLTAAASNGATGGHKLSSTGHYSQEGGPPMDVAPPATVRALAELEEKRRLEGLLSAEQQPQTTEEEGQNGALVVGGSAAAGATLLSSPLVSDGQPSEAKRHVTILNTVGHRRALVESVHRSNTFATAAAAMKNVKANKRKHEQSERARILKEQLKAYDPTDPFSLPPKNPSLGPSDFTGDNVYFVGAAAQLLHHEGFIQELIDKMLVAYMRTMETETFKDTYGLLSTGFTIDQGPRRPFASSTTKAENNDDFEVVGGSFRASTDNGGKRASVSSQPGGGARRKSKPNAVAPPVVAPVETAECGVQVDPLPEEAHGTQTEEEEEAARSTRTASRSGSFATAVGGGDLEGSTASARERRATTVAIISPRGDGSGKKRRTSEGATKKRPDSNKKAPKRLSIVDGSADDDEAEEAISDHAFALSGNNKGEDSLFDDSASDFGEGEEDAPPSKTDNAGHHADDASNQLSNAYEEAHSSGEDNFDDDEDEETSATYPQHDSPNAIGSNKSSPRGGSKVPTNEPSPRGGNAAAKNKPPKSTATATYTASSDHSPRGSGHTTVTSKPAPKKSAGFVLSPRSTGGRQQIVDNSSGGGGGLRSAYAPVSHVATNTRVVRTRNAFCQVAMVPCGALANDATSMGILFNRPQSSSSAASATSSSSPKAVGGNNTTAVAVNNKRLEALPADIDNAIIALARYHQKQDDLARGGGDSSATYNNSSLTRAASFRGKSSSLRISIAPNTGDGTAATVDEGLVISPRLCPVAVDANPYAEMVLFKGQPSATITAQLPQVTAAMVIRIHDYGALLASCPSETVEACEMLRYLINDEIAKMNDELNTTMTSSSSLSSLRPSSIAVTRCESDCFTITLTHHPHAATALLTLAMRIERLATALPYSDVLLVHPSAAAVSAADATPTDVQCLKILTTRRAVAEEGRMGMVEIVEPDDEEEEDGDDHEAGASDVNTAGNNEQSGATESGQSPTNPKSRRRRSAAAAMSATLPFPVASFYACRGLRLCFAIVASPPPPTTAPPSATAASFSSNTSSLELLAVDLLANNMKDPMHDEALSASLFAASSSPFNSPPTTAPSQHPQRGAAKPSMNSSSLLSVSQCNASIICDSNAVRSILADTRKGSVRQSNHSSAVLQLLLTEFGPAFVSMAGITAFAAAVAPSSNSNSNARGSTASSAAAPTAYFIDTPSANLRDRFYGIQQLRREGYTFATMADIADDSRVIKAHQRHLNRLRTASTVAAVGAPTNNKLNASGRVGGQRTNSPNTAVLEAAEGASNNERAATPGGDGFSQNEPSSEPLPSPFVDVSFKNLLLTSGPAHIGAVGVGSNNNPFASFASSFSNLHSLQDAVTHPSKLLCQKPLAFVAIEVRSLRHYMSFDEFQTTRRALMSVRGGKDKASSEIPPLQQQQPEDEDAATATPLSSPLTATRLSPSLSDEEAYEALLLEASNARAKLIALIDQTAAAMANAAPANSSTSGDDGGMNSASSSPSSIGCYRCVNWSSTHKRIANYLELNKKANGSAATNALLEAMRGGRGAGGGGGGSRGGGPSSKKLRVGSSARRPSSSARSGTPIAAAGGDGTPLVSAPSMVKGGNSNYKPPTPAAVTTAANPSATSKARESTAAAAQRIRNRLRHQRPFKHCPPTVLVYACADADSAVALAAAAHLNALHMELSQDLIDHFPSLGPQYDKSAAAGMTTTMNINGSNSTSSQKDGAQKGTLLWKGVPVRSVIGMATPSFAVVSPANGVSGDGLIAAHDVGMFENYRIDTESDDEENNDDDNAEEGDNQEGGGNATPNELMGGESSHRKSLSAVVAAATGDVAESASQADSNKPKSKSRNTPIVFDPYLYASPMPTVEVYGEEVAIALNGLATARFGETVITQAAKNNASAVRRRRQATIVAAAEALRPTALSMATYMSDANTMSNFDGSADYFGSGGGIPLPTAPTPNNAASPPFIDSCTLIPIPAAPYSGPKVNNNNSLQQSLMMGSNTQRRSTLKGATATPNAGAASSSRPSIALNGGSTLSGVFCDYRDDASNNLFICYPRAIQGRYNFLSKMAASQLSAKRALAAPKPLPLLGLPFLIRSWDRSVAMRQCDGDVRVNFEENGSSYYEEIGSKCGAALNPATGLTTTTSPVPDSTNSTLVDSGLQISANDVSLAACFRSPLAVAEGIARAEEKAAVLLQKDYQHLLGASTIPIDVGVLELASAHDDADGTRGAYDAILKKEEVTTQRRRSSRKSVTSATASDAEKREEENSDAEGDDLSDFEVPPQISTVMAPPQQCDILSCLRAEGLNGKQIVPSLLFASANAAGADAETSLPLSVPAVLNAMSRRYHPAIAPALKILANYNNAANFVHRQSALSVAIARNTKEMKAAAVAVENSKSSSPSNQMGSCPTTAYPKFSLSFHGANDHNAAIVVLELFKWNRVIQSLLEPLMPGGLVTPSLTDDMLASPSTAGVGGTNAPALTKFQQRQNEEKANCLIAAASAITSAFRSLVQRHLDAFEGVEISASKHFTSTTSTDPSVAANHGFESVSSRGVAPYPYWENTTVTTSAEKSDGAMDFALGEDQPTTAFISVAFADPLKAALCVAHLQLALEAFVPSSATALGRDLLNRSARSANSTTGAGAESSSLSAQRRTSSAAGGGVGGVGATPSSREGSGGGAQPSSSTTTMSDGAPEEEHLMRAVNSIMVAFNGVGGGIDGRQAGPSNGGKGLRVRCAMHYGPLRSRDAPSIAVRARHARETQQQGAAEALSFPPSTQSAANSGKNSTAATVDAAELIRKASRAVFGHSYRQAFIQDAETSLEARRYYGEGLTEAFELLLLGPRKLSTDKGREDGLSASLSPSPLLLDTLAFLAGETITSTAFMQAVNAHPAVYVSPPSTRNPAASSTDNQAAVSNKGESSSDKTNGIAAPQPYANTFSVAVANDIRQRLNRVLTAYTSSVEGTVAGDRGVASPTSPNSAGGGKRLFTKIPFLPLLPTVVDNGTSDAPNSSTVDENSQNLAVTSPASAAVVYLLPAALNSRVKHLSAIVKDVIRLVADEGTDRSATKSVSNSIVDIGEQKGDGSPAPFPSHWTPFEHLLAQDVMAATKQSGGVAEQTERTTGGGYGGGGFFSLPFATLGHRSEVAEAHSNGAQSSFFSSKNDEDASLARYRQHVAYIAAAFATPALSYSTMTRLYAGWLSTQALGGGDADQTALALQIQMESQMGQAAALGRQQRALTASSAVGGGSVAYQTAFEKEPDGVASLLVPTSTAGMPTSLIVGGNLGRLIKKPQQSIVNHLAMINFNNNNNNTNDSFAQRNNMFTAFNAFTDTVGVLKTADGAFGGLGGGYDNQSVPPSPFAGGGTGRASFASSSATGGGGGGQGGTRTHKFLEQLARASIATGMSRSTNPFVASMAAAAQQQRSTTSNANNINNNNGNRSPMFAGRRQSSLGIGMMGTGGMGLSPGSTSLMLNSPLASVMGNSTRAVGASDLMLAGALQQLFRQTCAVSVKAAKVMGYPTLTLAGNPNHYDSRLRDCIQVAKATAAGIPLPPSAAAVDLNAFHTSSIDVIEHAKTVVQATMIALQCRTDKQSCFHRTTQTIIAIPPQDSSTDAESAVYKRVKDTTADGGEVFKGLSHKKRAAGSQSFLLEDGSTSPLSSAVAVSEVGDSRRNLISGDTIASPNHRILAGSESMVQAMQRGYRPGGDQDITALRLRERRVIDLELQLERVENEKGVNASTSTALTVSNDPSQQHHHHQSQQSHALTHPIRASNALAPLALLASPSGSGGGSGPNTSGTNTPPPIASMDPEKAAETIANNYFGALTVFNRPPSNNNSLLPPIPQRSESRKQSPPPAPQTLNFSGHPTPTRPTPTNLPPINPALHMMMGGGGSGGRSTSPLPGMHHPSSSLVPYSGGGGNVSQRFPMKLDDPSVKDFTVDAGFVTISRIDHTTDVRGDLAAPFQATATAAATSSMASRNLHTSSSSTKGTLLSRGTMGFVGGGSTAASSSKPPLLRQSATPTAHHTSSSSSSGGALPLSPPHMNRQKHSDSAPTSLSGVGSGGAGRYETVPPPTSPSASLFFDGASDRGGNGKSGGAPVENTQRPKHSNTTRGGGGGNDPSAQSVGRRAVLGNGKLHHSEIPADPSIE